MNVIAFDDGPFLRSHRGSVLLVGCVCTGTRLDGVVSGQIMRDGDDAAAVMIDLVKKGRFMHVGAVLLQGIAVGGFNVIDVHALSASLEVPVLIVVRKKPDLEGVRTALFDDAPHARPRVPGAADKWRLIQSAGTIEPLGEARRAAKRKKVTSVTTSAPRLWVQRCGLSIEEARTLVAATTLHGNVPEPLRIAHLIAGGIVTGRSRGRA